MAWRALDEAVYTVDDSAAGWVPVQVREDIAQVATQRHAGTAWGRCESAQDAQASITLSTPSDTWTAIPVPIPVDPSATSLRLALRYTCATASVDVRLAYDGRIGSTSTLTTTASPTTVELSVTCQPQTQPVVLAELQVRSHRTGGAATETATVTEITADGAQWHLSSTSALSAGVTHYEAVVTAAPLGSVTGRSIYHVGRVNTHGSHSDLLVWPAWQLVWPDGGSATVDVYSVGALTVIGWCVWSEGGRLPALPTSIGRPGDQPSASLWTQGHGSLLEVYTTRGRVWACGPPVDGDSKSFGRIVDADDVATGALCERRTDAGGVLVRAWLLALDPTVSTTVTARVYGSDGTEEATGTVTVSGQPGGLRVGPQEDPTLSTAAWVVRARDGGRITGLRDVAAAGETLRPEYATGWVEAAIAIDWPAGVSVGELARVTVECDVDAHWRAVWIAEEVAP